MTMTEKISYVLFLSVFVYVFQRVETGIMCYNCTTPHTGICQQFDRCDDNEVCYREGQVTTSGVVYISGCKEKVKCTNLNNGGESLILGKRQGITECSKCCEEAYCNMALCDLYNTDIDHCTTNPCKNNGVCQIIYNAYTCTCANGYRGLHCEQVIHVDPCLSNPCKNHGICHSNNDAYTCTCVDGYNGLQCEKEIDPCLSHPCKNNGLCKRNNNAYTCTCVDGYLGLQCEKELPSCTGPGKFILGDYCYLITPEHTSWSSDACGRYNMRLAIVDSDKEHDGIWYNTRVKLNENRDFWLGGQYNTNGQSWQWIDGRRIPSDNHHWRYNDGRAQSSSTCMVFSGTMWKSVGCHEQNLHLCKSALRSTEVQTTTHHTRPDPYHCVGDRFFIYGHHCYYLMSTKIIHENYEACRNLRIGMDFAVIDSDEENIAVSHFIRNIINYDDVIWLRAYFQPTSHNTGYWRWRTGNPISWDNHNWKDDPHRYRECMVLDGDQWGIRNCNEHHYQLCKR